MQDLSVPTMRHELKALVHLSLILDDLTHIMDLSSNFYVQPLYFTEICRNFLNLVEDSVYLTDYVKQCIRKFILSEVHKTNVMEYQSEQISSICDYMDTFMGILRQGIWAKEG